MSNEATIKMIAAYNQTAPATPFLSGMFQARPENFHNSEEVEIDIDRDEEDVAVAIQDLSTGYRMNSDELYTNKSFKPPILKEAFAINGFDMLKRQVGNDPFADADFQGNAMLKAFAGFRKIEKKIQRNIELQASQVLTTGKVTLVDSAGTEVYTIDYKPKATHFFAAGTAWNDTSPTIIANILTLCELNRDDGLDDSDQLIMGSGSFEAAMQDSDFRNRFEGRRADLGRIAPMQVQGDGGQFRGVVEIGTYELEIWTYGGRYKHPQTGTKTKFIPDAKVIARSSQARLDLTFGAIPRIVPVDGRVLPFMPGRISSAAGGRDLFTNAWVTPDGEQLMGGIGARPLCIPTAIDTFGCISTGV